MTTLYAVIGYSHDGHEFKGVFDDLKKATEMKDYLESTKPDNWFIYDVETIKLNKAVDL